MIPRARGANKQGESWLTYSGVVLGVAGLYLGAMDQQAVFNRVYLHLTAQGAKSRTGIPGVSDGCAYRGDGGLQCAVGCLIKDEHFDPWWNLEAVCNPFVNRALEQSLGCVLTDDDHLFLGSLQSVHDNYPVGAWPARLAVFASARSLNIPEI